MINYMRSAVEQFVKYKSEHYVIRSEGHEIVEQAFLIACCNASQYGNNTFIAPRASITDGLMDVTVVHAGTRLGSFLTGIEIMAGTLGDSARVHTFRTSHHVADGECYAFDGGVDRGDDGADAHFAGGEYFECGGMASDFEDAVECDGLAVDVGGS